MKFIDQITDGLNILRKYEKAQIHKMEENAIFVHINCAVSQIDFDKLIYLGWWCNTDNNVYEWDIYI